MMRKKSGMLKSLLLVCVIIGAALQARAQGEGVLSHSWAMISRYVPAAAGGAAELHAALAGRMQWTGVEGAPRTGVLCVSLPTPLGGGALGAGLTAEIEKIGLFSNVSVSAQGAWHFKLGRGKLSAGISLGYYSTKFRSRDAVLPDGGGGDADDSGGDDGADNNDKPLPAQDLGGGAFDAGVGVQYSGANYYAGVGLAHITQPRVHLSIANSQVSDFETELPRTLYLAAGGNIRAGSTLIEIQPSVVARTDFHSFSGIALLRCVYRKLLSLGVGYRWREAITLQAGVQLRSVYIGYAYDAGVSGIAGRTRGSHEILATYTTRLDFSRRGAHRQRSIRFM